MKWEKGGDEQPGSWKALFPRQKKRLKQIRHLLVSFFHENEAREFEAAVGEDLRVKSSTNTP